MTDHGNLSALSGRRGWWHTHIVIPALAISALVMMGGLLLPTADSKQPAQRAPQAALAGSPAAGYAMDAAAKQRLAGEDRFQDYATWLHASHAYAAQHGQDAPLPSQF